MATLPGDREGDLVIGSRRVRAPRHLDPWRSGHPGAERALSLARFGCAARPWSRAWSSIG